MTPAQRYAALVGQQRYTNPISAANMQGPGGNYGVTPPTTGGPLPTYQPPPPPPPPTTGDQTVPPPTTDTPVTDAPKPKATPRPNRQFNFTLSGGNFVPTGGHSWSGDLRDAGTVQGRSYQQNVALGGGLKPFGPLASALGRNAPRGMR